MPSSQGIYATPGRGSIVQSVERNLFAGVKGYDEIAVYAHGVIENEARDARNTPTTDLGVGLVMAQDGSGNWREYDPDAAAALAWQRTAAGLLAREVRTVDRNNTAIDRSNPILIGGVVSETDLGGLDAQAKAQLRAAGFIIVAETGTALAASIPCHRSVVKTTAYTVVAADNGYCIQSNGAGALTHTLPAVAVGFRVRFVNLADQNMTITSAEGTNIIALNDDNATSVTVQTATELQGSVLEFEGIYADTTIKWLCTNLNGSTLTLA